MGMFDYIRCEMPLPDGWKAAVLQSKDFACEMVTHVITKEGRLMLERIDDVLEVPKDERPYPNEPDDSLLGLCGSVHRVKSLHDSNFHGFVNFYGHDKQNIWHEYNAKFTDGQLVEILAVTE